MNGSAAHPDLSALLRGELTNAEALAAAAHASSCPGCRTDLVDLSLGHGLLVASRRSLGEAPAPLAPLASQAGARESGVAPELSQVLPPELARELRASAPWRRRALAAVAAAVVLVAGLGLGLGAGSLLGGEDEGPGPEAVGQRATLEPVPGGVPSNVPGKVTGTVSMGEATGSVTRMRLDAAALPPAPRGGFYYVWLLDPATNKMLPLGQLTPGHAATFEVPVSLVAAYSAVDVSLESDDGDPGHSVTSVLRATYTPPRPSSTKTS